jgi:hypothetical protein
MKANHAPSLRRSQYLLCTDGSGILMVSLTLVLHGCSLVEDSAECWGGYVKSRCQVARRQWLHEFEFVTWDANNLILETGAQIPPHETLEV